MKAENQDLKLKYFLETERQWFDEEGSPTHDYMNWIEVEFNENYFKNIEDNTKLRQENERLKDGIEKLREWVGLEKRIALASHEIEPKKPGRVHYATIATDFMMVEKKMNTLLPKPVIISHMNADHPNISKESKEAVLNVARLVHQQLSTPPVSGKEEGI